MAQPSAGREGASLLNLLGHPSGRQPVSDGSDGSGETGAGNARQPHGGIRPLRFFAPFELPRADQEHFSGNAQWLQPTNARTGRSPLKWRFRWVEA